MQDRYAGDVGDYLNFGLLRWLCRPSFDAPPLRLGIVWYRVPDEDHNGDGKHVSYLDPERKSGQALRPLDPDLYDRLAVMVASGQRSIPSLQGAGVFLPDTQFFSNVLTYDDLPAGATADRAARRTAWVAAAHDAMDGAGLVFVDPDNGLRRADHSTPRTARKAVKHAYLDELVPFLDRGQSVVAYHHADRSGKVGEQARRRMADAAEELGVEPIGAVRASRGSTRLFLVVPVAAHRALLTDRLESLAGSPWASELKVIWNT